MSSSSSSSGISSNRAERISALNDNIHSVNDLFLPNEIICVDVLYSIVCVTVFLTFVYFISFLFVDSIIPSSRRITVSTTVSTTTVSTTKTETKSETSSSSSQSSSSSTSSSTTTGASSLSQSSSQSSSLLLIQQRQRLHDRRRKGCYQITNAVANTVLGLMGLYYEYFSPYHSLKRHTATIEETVVGFQDVIYLSTFQIGYQLFTIPIGLFYVNESAVMLLHHITVLSVTSMSSFLIGGFRYHTPFFYGIIELSSIPLSIMNIFKDNYEWTTKYPTLYQTIRLLFAFTFFIVRIIMFIPRKYRYLRDHYLLFSTSTILSYQIYMSFVWLSSFFLLCLQLYWGSLIFAGVFRLFIRNIPRNHKKTKNNDDEVSQRKKHDDDDDHGVNIDQSKKKKTTTNGAQLRTTTTNGIHTYSNGSRSMNGTTTSSKQH